MHILLAQFYSSQPTPDYDKIAEDLRGRGHTVWVGTPNGAGDVEWRDGQGVAATTAPWRPGLPRPIAKRLAKLSLLRRVRRFIAQTKPDIVQVNAFDLFRFLPVLMPRPTRYVLDVRQVNEQYGVGPVGRAKAALQNRSRVLYSRLLFDRTTFLHAAGARLVLGDHWAKWATVVPMGVDPQFLAVQPPNTPALPTGSRQVAHRTVEFIYIGRLTLRRHLERIIEAAAIVRQQTDQFRVIFRGYPADNGFYAGCIRQLGLESHVSIRPPIPYEQVPAATIAHDVALAYVPELPIDWMVHPTLKILEYRAMGLPIIATDFAPNRELVQDGVNGLLIQNTPASIAAAMLRYICDPGFLARSRAAAAQMRQGETWDEIATKYLTLYEQLRSGWK